MRSVTVFTYKIYHINRSAKLHVLKGDTLSTSQSHPTNDPCAYATDITFPWCDNEFTFRELCMINAIDQDSQINAVHNIKGWKRHGYNENHENCERCHFPVLLRWNINTAACLLCTSNFSPWWTFYNAICSKQFSSVTCTRTQIIPVGWKWLVAINKISGPGWGEVFIQGRRTANAGPQLNVSHYR